MDFVHVLFDELATFPVHTLCMSEKGKNTPPDGVAIAGGKRLVDCRKERGMTQSALSQATGYRIRKGGLSPSQISNFEQGTRRIGFEEAEILARVFPDYPSAYFMGGLTKREARLIIALRAEGDPLPKAG